MRRGALQKPSAPNPSIRAFPTHPHSQRRMALVLLSKPERRRGNRGRGNPRSESGKPGNDKKGMGTPMRSRGMGWGMLALAAGMSLLACNKKEAPAGGASQG